MTTERAGSERERPPATEELARPLPGPLRLVLIAAGFVATGIGILNFFVPGLPSTVFLIVAAWCFARSSPRFERWLLSLPKVGPLIRDYRAGLGMPVSAKVTAVTAITVAVTASTFALRLAPLPAIGLFAVGAIGAWVVLFRVPTRR